MTRISDTQAWNNFVSSGGRTEIDLINDMSRALGNVRDPRIRDEFAPLLRGMIGAHDVTPDNVNTFFRALERRKNEMANIYRNVPGYVP